VREESYDPAASTVIVSKSRSKGGQTIDATRNDSQHSKPPILSHTPCLDSSDLARLSLLERDFVNDNSSVGSDVAAHISSFVARNDRDRRKIEYSKFIAERENALATLYTKKTQHEKQLLIMKNNANTKAILDKEDEELYEEQQRQMLEESENEVELSVQTLEMEESKFKEVALEEQKRLSAERAEKRFNRINNGQNEQKSEQYTRSNSIQTSRSIVGSAVVPVPHSSSSFSSSSSSTIVDITDTDWSAENVRQDNEMLIWQQKMKNFQSQLAIKANNNSKQQQSNNNQQNNNNQQYDDQDEEFDHIHDEKHSAHHHSNSHSHSRHSRQHSRLHRTMNDDGESELY